MTDDELVRYLQRLASEIREQRPETTEGDTTLSAAALALERLAAAVSMVHARQAIERSSRDEER